MKKLSRSLIQICQLTLKEPQISILLKISSELIGQGQFANSMLFQLGIQVYKISSKKNNQNYALKVFQKVSLKNLNLDNANEIELMKQLKHPRVIKIYEVYEDKEFICIVMELMQNSMKQQEKRYSEHQCDFCNPMSIYQYQRCGIPGYVAPEVLRDLKYDFKVDVYSAGIILYTLLEQLSNRLLHIHKMKLFKNYLILMDNQYNPFNQFQKKFKSFQPYNL